MAGEPQLGVAYSFHCRHYLVSPRCIAKAPAMPAAVVKCKKQLQHRVVASLRTRRECRLECKHSAGIFHVAHSLRVLQGHSESVSRIPWASCFTTRWTTSVRERVHNDFACVPTDAKSPLRGGVRGNVSADKYLSLRCYLSHLHA
jgi:hypothetical protein